VSRRRRVKSGRTAFGDALGQFPKRGELSVKCRRRGKDEFVPQGRESVERMKEERKSGGGAVWRSREEKKTRSEGSSLLSLQRGPSSPAATAGKKLAPVGPQE
jgi:hypothetical protein